MFQENGSAIFLHCSLNKPTQGCIAIKREKMVELLKNINDVEGETPKIIINSQKLNE